MQTLTAQHRAVRAHARAITSAPCAENVLPHQVEEVFAQVQQVPPAVPRPTCGALQLVRTTPAPACASALFSAGLHRTAPDSSSRHSAARASSTGQRRPARLLPTAATRVHDRRSAPPSCSHPSFALPSLAHNAERPRDPGGATAFMSAHSKTPYYP